MNGLVEDPESAGEAVEVYSKELAGTYEGIVAAKMGERERERGVGSGDKERRRRQAREIDDEEKNSLLSPTFVFLLL
jgi:hypothetical protein